MASSSIKGLTIEIGASTEKFTTAMKSLDSETRAISKDLKTVSENLKLDPKSVTAAAEKLKLLQEQAANAGKKVETIAAAIEKFKATRADTTSDDYRKSLEGLERQLESAKREQELANAQVEAFQRASEDAGNGASRLGDIIKGNLISEVIKKGLSGLADLLKSVASFAINAAKQVGEYAKAAVEMAAEWQDALGYSEQVFGSYSETVQKWVEDNSLKLRVGETALIQYVNKFGALFRTFGFGAKEAAENSEALIQLAVDLRAATGDDLTQIIDSLTSGLTGGYKAFQRYGVVVNEARIQVKALELGLVDVEVNQLAVEKATIKVTEANKKAAEALAKYGENSLEYQKAQIAVQEAEEALTAALGGKTLALDDVAKKTAILAILNEDLAFAEGQAAKESGSYSSQLALKDTLLENLQKRIGEKLLPVFTAFITKINDFMQSDAGKAVLDALTDSVGILADKVMELLESEKLTEWLSSLEEKAPVVAEKIVEITTSIAELIPQLLTLTEKILTFIGIGTGADIGRARYAFIRVKDDIKKFADESGLSLDQAVKAITAYSETTGVKLDEIYDNWSEYEPLIKQWYDQLSTDAEGAATDFDTAMSQLPESTQENLDDVADKITTFTDSDALRAKVRGWGDKIKEAFKSTWDWLVNAYQTISRLFGSGWDVVDQDTASELWPTPMATGGRAYARRPYLVGDDSQHRPEIFVPDTNGYIMNGSQTERIINNTSNSQNFSGGINIYVNSYGMNVAEVADELGAAFQQKIRMSGAMI